MKAFLEPARKIPIAHEADVVVVGAGPGGILAALGAARTGAKTLLIEKFGCVGGLATSGLMTSFNGFRNELPPDHVQTVRGFVQELIDRLLDAGGACGCTGHGNFGTVEKGCCPYAVSFDPETMKLVALEMLLDAGVEFMFHTTFGAAYTDGRNVDVIAVENKSGRQGVKGAIYVDATGDGDLAARAGARCEKVDKVGQRMMGMSLMCRVAGMPEPGKGQSGLWANGITTRWGPSIGEMDGSDAADMTAAEIQTRRRLAAYVAGLREQHPDAVLVESAAIIGVRETRRVVGLYEITEEDCLTGAAHDDSIAVSSNPVPGYYGKRRFFDHLGFEIPYRSLVPADLDNVVLAGRCISASQPAFQSARSMAPAMAISQASGTAAAMSVAAGCKPADLDVAALQQKLEDDGAVIRIPPDERSKLAGSKSD